MRLLGRLLAAMLAMAALAGPLAAHETTRSYLLLKRGGAEVSARLRLAFRDIEVATWMDEDLDGQITWGEARARLDATISYASARLALGSGGACPLRSTGAGVSRSGALDYLDLTFQATCPDATGPIELRTSLFAEFDPSHRLFVTISDRGQETSLVVEADSESVLLDTQGGQAGVFAAYFKAGVEHLLAGMDHLVFLLVLILPAVAGPESLRRRTLGVVAAVTGFTVAHALTLTAAATDLFRPPSVLIEILIALSILVTAADNVRPFIPGPRAALAGFFGTIHGFGFATALSALPLGSAGFAMALLGFNLGVEVAQVAIVLLAMPVLMMAGGGPWVLRLGSAMAALIAAMWLWQRLPPIVE